jgi:hypothetical protein
MQHTGALTEHFRMRSLWSQFAPWQKPSAHRAARKRRSSGESALARGRRCCVEHLEPRYLLSFTFVGSVGGGKSKAWGDVNNDGWVDIYNGDSVMLNDNGSFFSNSISGDNIEVPGQGWALWGDFDNDEYLDIYSYDENRLFRNINGTSFVEIALPPAPNSVRRGAALGDFNNDSYLDMYVAGYEDSGAQRDFILTNNQNHTFTVSWVQSDIVPGRGVTAADFDQDGDLDVYVSNYRLEPNFLYRNDGSGNFVNVAVDQSHPNTRNTDPGWRGGHSIGAAWGDFNSDGLIDLFAGNFAHDDNRGDQPESRFLRNRGPADDYRFDDMGQSGVFYQESYASPAVGDYNNDGYPDLFFTTVYSTASFGVPNRAVLFHNNNGSWSFSDVTAAEGLGDISSTYQAAWADYDNDGDLDLITGANLYRNNGNSNNWLSVHLKGDGNLVNSAAIGSTVRAAIDDLLVTRVVEAGTGEGNANDLTLHFGLGSYAGEVALEISWADGTVENIRVDANQRIEYVYGTDPPVDPPVEEETEVYDIGEVGKITNLTHLPQTITLNRSYQNPVVFAQSASNNEPQSAVPRVTNVQSNQFTIYLAESPDGSGSHASETVTYVVLEAGRHLLHNGSALEVGLVDTSKTVGNQISNSWEPVSFSESFSETPVVLTQVQTTSGSPYLKTRHLETSPSSVILALEQEEAVTTPSVEETVGYLALSQGPGTWNSMRYEAGVTLDAVTDAFYSHSFTDPFESAPSLLTSLSTYDSPDNASVRYSDLTSSSVNLKIDEDESFDAEVAHTTEAVSYLAIEGEGTLTAQVPQLNIGEVGKITDLTHALQTISVIGNYTNPVVFAQSASTSDSEPAVVRVTNVQSDQFSMYVAEPSNQGASHGSETVTYVVVEAGTYRLSDGTRIEAGTVDTTKTVGKSVSNAWESVNFESSFAETPVVLSQIQTTHGAPLMQTRYLTTSASSVLLALEPEEQTTSQSVQETIGYLAIEPGTGTWSGFSYEAAVTSNDVTDVWFQLSYDTAFEIVPSLLTSLSTYTGNDNARVRYTNTTPTGVQLKVEEDTTFDLETEHPKEAVAYLAIGGEGRLSVPMPEIEIGEVGSITNLTHQSQTIQLERDYLNPVVFSQSASTGDSQPAVVRVSNVQSDRFAIFLAEPSPTQGSSHGSETVTYVVLEAGTHQLGDSTQVHVGTIDTSATVGNQLSNSWEPVNFNTSFASTPVVLSQVQSNNNPGYLQTRHLSSSSSSLILGLEQQESLTSAAQTETVGYLAISEAAGSWNGFPYEAGKTDNAVTDAWYQLSYGSDFEDTPNLLTSLATYDGGDNAHVRYQSPTPSDVQLKVEEDTSFDLETAHTTEIVAFLAIGGQGILTAFNSVTPPLVIDFQQNGTAGASNELATLSYTFNEAVVVTVADLTLKNTNAGGAAVDLTGIEFHYDPDTYQATWDFSSVAAIGANSYSVTLAATSIVDLLGNPLDGNADGIGGDDYLHTIIVAYAGDYNSDNTVDTADYTIWRDTLGSSVPAFSGADGNGNGTIDQGDYSVWRDNYGTTLATATASSVTVEVTPVKPVTPAPMATPLTRATATAWANPARPASLPQSFYATLQSSVETRPPAVRQPDTSQDDAMLALYASQAHPKTTIDDSDLHILISDLATDDSRDTAFDAIDAGTYRLQAHYQCAEQLFGWK